MKRAQMETFGLIFVVLILLVAFMYYISLSGNSSQKFIIEQRIDEASLFGRALETAILKTTVPVCDTSFEDVLRRCVSKPYLTCGLGSQRQEICSIAHNTWNELLTKTLYDQGRIYRAQILADDTPLSISGVIFNQEPYGEICDGNDNTYAGPTQPIPTTAGELNFVIEFCQ